MQKQTNKQTNKKNNGKIKSQKKNNIIGFHDSDLTSL